MEVATEQAGPNCFVFRTSEDEFVQRELGEGRLRQGWSPQCTSLLDDNGGERSKEEWTEAYVAAWNEEPGPRRHGVLRRMLDIQVDDVLLCPKAPTYGFFTIARARERYRFELAAGHNDFGHIISVENRRVVSNAHNRDSVTISDLFRSAYFRPPVARVQAEIRQDVLEAAMRLLNEEDTSECRDTYQIRQELYDEGRRTAASSLMGHVDKWSFEQFEAAVGGAFKRKGYERLLGKSSRNGGDADHVFSMPMPGFEQADLHVVPVLIVQVKHKQGIDQDDVVGLRQLLDWEPDQNGDMEVRLRVLFSSANSSTDPCKRLAEKCRVVLIGGIEAGLFML